MRLPYWLVIFVFMLNLGLMFWALENPRERRLPFVFSIALCVALPHVPTKRTL